ncbi:hypothetical protein [Natronobacterium gregoryi]|uniref:Uncharacterized protein n=1 Tax=Natronobacterium gregoryi (strain ATCC 43098 / DSM 3393 / CCM 3738 / CIP 104747 / IAM 13177 / JCM 8860 / NBRC 102187 / NCIMB 2189 / SP2) TaxID=797304 RepID=L9Y3F0_NATGS|nr:hypothetical protein [Natronobacterium gregoryi]ELY68216.1 hypothetical protein C490_10035 [Natronobacterium gregoryi SP2]
MNQYGSRTRPSRAIAAAAVVGVGSVGGAVLTPRRHYSADVAGEYRLGHLATALAPFEGESIHTDRLD